jgi:hypothetical protein
MQLCNEVTVVFYTLFCVYTITIVHLELCNEATVAFYTRFCVFTTTVVLVQLCNEATVTFYSAHMCAAILWALNSSLHRISLVVCSIDGLLG